MIEKLCKGSLKITWTWFNSIYYQQQITPQQTMGYFELISSSLNSAAACLFKAYMALLVVVVNLQCTTQQVGLTPGQPVMYNSAGGSDPRSACHVQLSRWVWPQVSLSCTTQQVGLTPGQPVMYNSAGGSDPRSACHVQLSRWVWPKVSLSCTNKQVSLTQG